ncbi:enoyl-[acyl-carrier protein] reductase/trans-2-enoyl-CoA reductase (NAD+) [Hydrogenoanaerobacterium saccharovorans]|uniref:Trans-2-enoyl-CoA reductase [NADH] n=1 Tax=Hydrogenoanaerobacterium saccharovorans TaxID=474960 RepID=A0A1H8CQS1_9FIRM|nr:enoyl-ACP reductase FabV [Hydrogenoanaerobacterium saccharovorans]RPF43261.1 enoyl-[acyl-carrier protein] reductase/trans-2-enoyl-CoA reductase (NAD+) [Hydrogenoanaerobacterium saccharovorans]SEM97316.1 enoyl-[acyl-carrier protein] reductase / trans-2-enoyl-CoA reductase (NAD+) [Hydrogenoanaerobacterium saccharovorans]
MIVEPKVRGFICTTAHAAGCRENVKRQIDYVKSQPKVDGAKKVLVIGASTGYGLASRISAAFGCGAATIGIIFDKEANGNRTASAGWYNTAAFEEFAQQDGIYAKTINGDAFSQEIKDKTIALIKKDLGKVDLIVYSLASPRRTDTDGTVYSSVLKTTGAPYTNKTIDLRTNMISEITIPSATEEEIAATVKVMGGEDWKDWITALKAADVIEDGAMTVAYSYIGPALTHPMYLNGSIGMAKKHLYKTADGINSQIAGVKAYVSVNKALVTQSSSAIPVVPLYISILYKVMKAKGTHEGCIEQMYRLLHERLYAPQLAVDEQGLIRIDDWEMRQDVQDEVTVLWQSICDENVKLHADIDGYWEDFYQMFGFHFPNICYSDEIEIDVKIPSINE